MANMRWTFSDIYTKVSEYLGTGSAPTGTDLTRAKNIVYRGYMKFLLPINPKDQEVYIWSWLKQPWKLSLEPDKWEYSLPRDFDRFYRELRFDSYEGGRCIEQTSEDAIMSNRSNLEFGSYPEKFAIRTAKFDKSVGSVKEIIFYPTPASRTVVNGTYVMTPDKPENDADYVIGNALDSEAILQCCLAVAENEQDEKIGVETQRAVELVQSLIRKDKGDSPNTVGSMSDGNLSVGSIFSYRDYWIPRGTYTVYGIEI